MEYYYGGEHHEQLVTGKRKSSIQRLVKKIKKNKLNKLNTCLVGVGISGALLVPAIADILGMKFILIRERNSNPIAYTGQIVGILKKKAIFIDDLISEGKTLRRANKILKKHDTEIVAAVTHEPYDGSYCPWGSDDGKKNLFKLSSGFIKVY